MDKESEAGSLVRPFQTLREQVSALEEAMGQVTAEPGERAVHRLRTTTRRVEAQMRLLKMLGRETKAFALPGREQRRLRRLLQQIRRIAGHVRDLDVQKRAVQELAGEPGQDAVCKDLLVLLEKRRGREARKLTAGLAGHTGRVGPELERLLAAQGASRDRTVAAEQVGKLTRAWFAGRMLPDLDSAGDEDLHDVRKSAKVARYLAESAGLKSLGERFEAVQEAGGRWHDHLAMAAMLRRRLGKESGLAERFERREEAALRDFRTRLEGWVE